jgi:ADP-ribose pyrophosphatase
MADKTSKSLSDDYLSWVLSQPGRVGDHKKGEIEIVTDPDTVAAVVKGRRNLQRSDLSNGVGSVGLVFEDEYIIVIRDPVIFPDGSAGTYLRIIERPALDGPAGVVILPVYDNLIYLHKVFRHATRGWELECPRGARPHGFTAADNVKQEIAEELGVGIKNMIELGLINPHTGFVVGPAQAYWVELDTGNITPRPKQKEAFGEVVPLTLEQLAEEIRKGEVRDGFTLAVLQLAQAHKLISLW